VVARAVVRAVLLFGIVVSGCSRIVHWQQEVRLHDGRMLVVERASLSGEGPGAVPHVPKGGDSNNDESTELAFVHPDTAETIRWILPKGTVPHMLDVDGPAVFLVLAPSSIADYNQWQCPNPPWVVYRHLSGIWMRVPIGDLPERFETPNLLAWPGEEIQASPRVSWSDMVTHLKTMPPEYRRISRQPINPLDKGCQTYLLRQLGREQEGMIGR
jgi:hypothetical protein